MLMIFISLLLLEFSETFVVPGDLVDLYPYAELTQRIELENQTIYFKLNGIKNYHKYEVRLSYLGTMRLHVNLEEIRLSKQDVQTGSRRLLEQALIGKVEVGQKPRQLEIDKEILKSQDIKFTSKVNSIQKLETFMENYIAKKNRYLSYPFKNVSQLKRNTSNHNVRCAIEIWQDNHRRNFKSRRLLDLEKTFINVDSNLDQTVIVVAVNISLWSPAWNGSYNKPKFVEFNIMLAEIVLGGLPKDSVPIVIAGIIIVLLVLLLVPIWTRQIVPGLLNWLTKGNKKVKE